MSAFISGLLKSVFKRSGAKGIKSIAPAVVKGIKASSGQKAVKGIKAVSGAVAKAKFLAQPLGKLSRAGAVRGVKSTAGLFPPKESSTAGKEIVKSAGKARFLGQKIGKTIKPDLSKIGKDPLTKLAKQAGAGLLGGSALIGGTIALAKKKKKKNKK